MYPSEVFLRERIKAAGLAPKEIALRAGYANIAKGIRRLEEFLRQGRGGGQLAGRLPEILGFPAAILEEKLRETEAVLEREQEARTVYDLQGRVVPAASYQDRSIHNGVLRINFGRGWQEITSLPGL